MPRVTFHPSGKSGDIPEKKSLLEAAQLLGVDLAHECGGFASCSTCRVVVEDGHENLTGIEFEEEDMMDLAALLPPHRLACQAKVLGDVTVIIPGESR
ncbi:MAG: 2Fe-2S iron-sulfur cluster binding domain-containing protein [Nitrospirae bacterium]|nr:2Fe-2S iron-sulfur cluster binding domain-containing protein [Nitrospirota bacterium]